MKKRTGGKWSGACAKILGVTAKDMARKDVDKYYPVPSDALLAMTTAPVDIFVGRDSGKLERLFEEGHEIEQQIARKYFLDHESCLFVLSVNRLQFADGFSEQVFDFIAKDDISPESRVKATGMAFTGAHEVIKMAGNE